MTGTKIVKLNLDGGGVGDRLPRLKEGLVEEAVRLFTTVNSRGDVDDAFDEIVNWARGSNFNSALLQRVVDGIEKEYGVGDIAVQYRLGPFLSALINASTETDLKVSTKTPLAMAGYRLGEGNRLTIEGDVDDAVGQNLRGGEVVVEGDAGNFVGLNARGGKITVRGNAGNFIGKHMENTIINLEGQAGSIETSPISGEIWHRGERVWPR
ncbi:MAG: hypothetical protein V1921_06440 [Candidatus Altiarchaeota archaeon]